MVDAYANNFTAAGFDNEVTAIRAAHQAGDRASALAAISDKMVREIQIVGDETLVSRAVDAYRGAGVDVRPSSPHLGSDRQGCPRHHPAGSRFSLITGIASPRAAGSGDRLNLTTTARKRLASAARWHVGPYTASRDNLKLASNSRDDGVRR